MPDHSPLPWRAARYGSIKGPDGKQLASCCICPDEATRDVNAALIVRAVNAHQAMLDELTLLTLDHPAGCACGPCGAVRLARGCAS